MADIYQEALQERFEELKKELDLCIASFVAMDSKGRNEQVGKFLFAGTAYEAILPKTAHPTWLTRLMTAARRFHNQEHNASEFLKAIVGYYNHARPVDLGEEWKCDFDQLYARLRDEGELPELFDKIIAAVEDMLNNDALDIASVIEALHRLIGVLRQNRKGSFIAAANSLSFARYMKHLLIELAKQVPLLGVAVTAYERAVEATDARFHEINDSLGQEALNLVIDQRLAAKLSVATQPPTLHLDGSRAENQLGDERKDRAFLTGASNVGMFLENRHEDGNGEQQ